MSNLSVIEECGLKELLKKILSQTPCPIREDMINNYLNHRYVKVIEGSVNKALADCLKKNVNLCVCLEEKILGTSIKKWIIGYVSAFGEENLKKILRPDANIGECIMWYNLSKKK